MNGKLEGTMASVDAAPAWSAMRARVADYIVLSKFRLSLLVLITVAAGYAMGVEGELQPARLLHAMAGVAVLAFAASALNQYMERDLDARMERTRNRPLPSGRVHPREAMLFGVAGTVAGFADLYVFANPLAAWLGLATTALYLFLYTPLKVHSSFNTLVGAIPGAMPPLIGWVAATGALDAGAWVMFGIVFLWQVPHFMAVALLYREDYGSAGMDMLSLSDARGGMAMRQAALYCLAMLPISLLPAKLGMAGIVYFAAAAAVTLLFLASCVAVALWRTRRGVRGMFGMSLAHLVVLFAAMVMDKQTV